jgi:AraC-like DNA-binding protein
MPTTYSTRDVHERERLAYWREVATRGYAEHTFRTSVGAAFQGNIQFGLISGLGIATFECDACEATRTAHHVARADSDDLLFSLPLAGKIGLVQDDREALIERGSFALVDTLRPFTTTLQTAVTSIVFKISRQALEARMGAVGPITAQTIRTSGPAAALASGFLAMLPAHMDTLTGPASLKIADQAIDLVALALSEATDQRGTAISSRAGIALLRLKSVIEAHLREPDLSPTAVALQAGISVRYAHALLSRMGSSVSRYILDRRLEECRRALENPAQTHRTIGEIAYSWGFSDLSHFGRRFRKRFGCSPREYRQRR